MTAALGLVLAIALAAPADAPMPAPRPDAPVTLTEPGPGAILPRPRPAPPEPVVAVLPRPMPAPMPAPEEIVCRDPRLMGDPKPDLIEIDRHVCGIFEPVRVRSVAGMRLKPPILVGCPTARRLADWLDGTVRPEVRERLGARIAVVRTMGSYACRTRNHVAGGRLSEHARGRAVDIGGFTLTNGRDVSVERHWGAGPGGAFLRDIWRKACGPFATVLGPEADRHHRNHFHLDTAPRGGEPYCR